jgi:type I restriction enzyme S subunit
MEEWKEYKLKDICIKITDGSHSSPRGVDDGYPMFSVKDMQEYGFDYSKCKYVSYDDFLSLKQNDCVPQKGDVLVAKDGSYLKQIFVCKETRDEGILSSIAIFRPNTIVDSFFLCYLLKSPEVYNYIANNCVSGSALPRIVLKDFKEVKLRVPSLTKQKEIVSILKSLDDKIEVNHKINENLEQQAQALFKSWFVDFEPFKNGEFVESELGMIPKGWRVGTLDEIGDVVGGSTPSKSKPEFYTDKGIAWLTPKDLSISNNKFTAKGEIDITEEGYKSCSTKLMPKGSVLFSSRAPIGYITIAKNDICTNQGFKSVVPKLAGTAFIYYFLKISTKDIENKATGSTFKEASGALMKSLQLIIAPERILHDFENIMKPLFTQQEVLEDESRRLAGLRDTLLPKLMSGELNVFGKPDDQS